MSMTTGALPFGPLEEDGWEAAGWKANLVRSMVGAEVPLDEVKEAGRRRFMAGPAFGTANTALGEENRSGHEHGMLTARDEGE